MRYDSELDQVVVGRAVPELATEQRQGLGQGHVTLGADVNHTGDPGPKADQDRAEQESGIDVIATIRSMTSCGGTCVV